MARFRRLVGALVLAAAPAAGADFRPEFGNATVEDVSATGVARAVERALRAPDEPVWVAWQVEGIPRRGSICCAHGCCCDVERSPGGVHIDSEAEDGPIAVLVRFSGGEPNRIRVAGRDCWVTFGGRRVLWAGATDTGTSIRLLEDLTSAASRRVVDGAVMAIAFHDDPAATGWLETTALTDGDTHRSEQAIFWLGATRREDGLASLRTVLRGDIGVELREAVIFALSQSPIAGARDDLVRLARHDQSSRIRQEALFWLGQTDDEAIAELIYEVALEDPDPEIARHAVFTLSQVREPLALEFLARLLVQKRRPEIRKDALFWIGQTDSDEALEIVARLLNE